MVKSFSTFGKSAMFMIGQMSGALASYDELASFSIVQTFLLSFSFYFIISGILSNMYWVFVKNELVNFEIQKQK